MKNSVAQLIKTTLITALGLLILFFSGCKKDDDKSAPQANRAPGEFTVTTAPDLNSVLISWTAATDPDGDEVSYMIILEDDTLVHASTQTFHEEMSLVFETEYNGSVIASDPDGLTLEKPFSFTTGVYPNVAPLGFDIIYPGNGSSDLSIPFDFNWNDAIDPDGDEVYYEILFDTNSIPSFSLVTDLSASQYQYTGPELENGQTYYWQVIARDGNGGETSSQVFHFTTTTLLTLASDEPGWEDRTNHASVVFQGKMWVIGGASCCGGRYADVWSSIDGENWVEELSDAPWGGRAAHSCVVYDDKIWLIGGNSAYSQSSIFGDVWYTANGVDWVLATDSPPFLPRFSHHLLSYGGYMWMFGGRDSDATFDQRQVWRTTDGVDWEMLVDTGAVYFNSSQMVVFDNKMWRISSYNNDMVQSTTDGVNWFLELDDAPFGERNGHSCTVHDGKVWLLSGSDNSVNELYELPDVWSSVDGVDWELVSSNAGFEAVNGAETLSHDGKLWLLGGGGGWQSSFVTDDVWFLE